MQKRHNISLSIAAVILLALTACGSIWDFEIANTDEFASLPSGHSAYSMFAIFLFPTLGDYVRGLARFKPYLLAFGFAWWASTALSRMTVGAHYLTDVTIAGLVTVMAYIVVSVIQRIYRKRKGMEKVKYKK